MDNLTSQFNTETTEQLPGGPADHLPDGLRPADVLGVVLMSALVIVTFNANLWIVVVITITPQLRGSLANIFIVNLCCVDLLASMVVMPLSVVTFVKGEDALGNTACNVCGYVSTCVMITSVLSLCVISMERYYTITLPMHHAGHATPCLYLVVVATVWLISLFVAMFPLVGINSYKYRSSKRACVFYWQGGTSGDKSFIIVVFIISFLMPSAILLSMYIGIFRVAKKAATVIAPNAIPPTRCAVNASENGSDLIFAISQGHSCMGNTPQIKVQEVSVAGSSRCENRRMSAEDSGIRTADYTDTWSVQSVLADHNDQNHQVSYGDNQEDKSHNSGGPQGGKGDNTSECHHDKTGNKKIVNMQTAKNIRLNTANRSNAQVMSSPCGMCHGTNKTSNSEPAHSDSVSHKHEPAHSDSVSHKHEPAHSDSISHKLVGTFSCNGQTFSCNNGTLSSNNVPVSCNNGTFSSNYVPVSRNNGPLSSNNGTLSSNNVSVSRNIGTISSNNGTFSSKNVPVSRNNGTLSNNNGTFSCINGSVSCHDGIISCCGCHDETVPNNLKPSVLSVHRHHMTNGTRPSVPRAAVRSSNNHPDILSGRHETPVTSSQPQPPPHRVRPSHMKAFKTLMIIVVSYLVQWTPYFACQLHGLLVGHSASDALELVVHWVSLTSYALNPVLYGCMNRMIRDELTQLVTSLWNFCCCCVCVCHDTTNGGVSGGCHVTCHKLTRGDATRGEALAEEDAVGGAESFYQFLQRTEASDHVQDHVGQDGAIRSGSRS